MRLRYKGTYKGSSRTPETSYSSTSIKVAPIATKRSHIGGKHLNLWTILRIVVGYLP